MGLLELWLSVSQASPHCSGLHWPQTRDPFGMVLGACGWVLVSGGPVSRGFIAPWGFIAFAAPGSPLGTSPPLAT